MNYFLVEQKKTWVYVVVVICKGVDLKRKSIILRSSEVKIIEEKQKTILEETQAILAMRENQNKEVEISLPNIEPTKQKKTTKTSAVIKVVLVIGLIIVTVTLGLSLLSNQRLTKENKHLKNTITVLTEEKNQLNKQLEQFKEDYQQALLQTSNMYLTFDDGPTHQTEALLDILKHYNVKATFFVLGDKQPELYQRIVNEGHSLALHSSTHQYQQIYASVDDYFNDLYALQTNLENITGVKSKVFRFPGGSSNTIASQEVMMGIIERANSEGFVYFDWNCDSKDSSETNVSVETIIQQSTSCSMQNIVLLMHDSKDKQTTVEALPGIINYFKTKNYVFRTLNIHSLRVQHKTSQ